MRHRRVPRRLFPRPDLPYYFSSTGGRPLRRRRAMVSVPETAATRDCSGRRHGLHRRPPGLVETLSTLKARLRGTVALQELANKNPKFIAQVTERQVVVNAS
jgi:hypothetical protein